MQITPYCFCFWAMMQRRRSKQRSRTYIPMWSWVIMRTLKLNKKELSFCLSRPRCSCVCVRRLFLLGVLKPASFCTHLSVPVLSPCPTLLFLFLSPNASVLLPGKVNHSLTVCLDPILAQMCRVWDRQLLLSFTFYYLLFFIFLHKETGLNENRPPLCFRSAEPLKSIT